MTVTELIKALQIAEKVDPLFEVSVDEEAFCIIIPLTHCDHPAIAQYENVSECSAIYLEDL